MITAIPLVAATAKLTTPQARAASASVDMRPGNADDGHPGVFPRALQRIGNPGEQFAEFVRRFQVPLGIGKQPCAGLSHGDAVPDGR